MTSWLAFYVLYLRKNEIKAHFSGSSVLVPLRTKNIFRVHVFYFFGVGASFAVVLLPHPSVMTFLTS